MLVSDQVSDVLEQNQLERIDRLRPTRRTVVGIQLLNYLLERLLRSWHLPSRRSLLDHFKELLLAYLFNADLAGLRKFRTRVFADDQVIKFF